MFSAITSNSRVKYLVLAVLALATFGLLSGSTPAQAVASPAPVVTSASPLTMDQNAAPVSISFTTTIDLDGTNTERAVSIDLKGYKWGTGFQDRCFYKYSWACTEFTVTATDANGAVDLSMSQYIATVNNYNIPEVSLTVNQLITAGTTFEFTLKAGLIQPIDCTTPQIHAYTEPWWLSDQFTEDFDVTNVPAAHKTVTFAANNAMISDVDKIQCGSSSTALTPNPFRITGSSFAGWSTTADGTGTRYNNRQAYSFTSDVTLYAQWVSTNTATVSTTGGFLQGVNPNPVVVTFVTKELLPSTGTDKYGTSIEFVLNGVTNDTFTRYKNCLTTAPCSSLTLTASSGALPNSKMYVSSVSSNGVWITLYLGGNEVPIGTTFTLTMPGNLVSLTSGSFAGVTTYISSQTLERTVNTPFNAKASRTVTYNTGGGTAIDTGTVIGPIPQPATTKAGYTLQGWYTAATGGQLITFPYDPYNVTTLTMYARWTASTNVVTYNTDGGSNVNNGSFVTGGSLTLPAATPTKANHTFLGWFEAASGGTALTSPYTPSATGPITIYAHWRANSVVVTYNTAGGSSVANGNFIPGGTLTLPADPTKPGYAFDGWFEISSGGTALVSGYSPSATSAFTLYAHWTANSNTVHYDTHGGSSVANGHFTTGGNLTLPSDPTREGYAFDGWFEDETGGSALASTFAPSATDAITVHAQWTPNSNGITYSVDGGSAVAEGSFLTGGQVTLAGSPTKDGYSFDGWFTDAVGGSALNDGFTPSATGPITLYAHWTKIPRTVKFDANGGNGIIIDQTSSTVWKLFSNTILRDGYYFDHWNTAADGSGTDYTNEGEYDFNADLTLYAQWREIPIKPIATIKIEIPIGSPVADAPVALQADGLLDKSHYTVTVHSTPQIVDEGTIWSGRLQTTIRIPANLEPGWHRLIIDGTAADGTPWKEVNYFKVTESGLLGAVAKTDPALEPTDEETPVAPVDPEDDGKNTAVDDPEDVIDKVDAEKATSSPLPLLLTLGGVAAVAAVVSIRQLRKRRQKD